MFNKMVDKFSAKLSAHYMIPGYVIAGAGLIGLALLIVVLV